MKSLNIKSGIMCRFTRVRQLPYEDIKGNCRLVQELGKESVKRVKYEHASGIMAS